jgi:phosphate transport system substrate-binding protein
MSAEVGRRAILLAVGGALGAACDRRARVDIRGAGATLPAPLYEAWAVRYEALRPAVRIEYAPIGSGGGLRQLSRGTVDFGASDVEPDAVERRALGEDPIVAPVAKSALAIAVNVPGDKGGPPIALDLETLARVYLGEVTRWDAPALSRLNPGRTLPPVPVVPIARSDGGGSTSIFSSRLADAVPRLRERLGVGRAVVFPAAVGARGSDGVARAVASTPGAVGYVEVTHASRAGLSLAAVARAGEPATLPTVAAVRDAAVVGSASGYPFAAYTYLVLPRTSADEHRAAALAHFSWWILGPGQGALAPREADALASAFQPIPEALAREARERLLALRASGRALVAID